MQACWDAAGEVIKAWATEGHSVALPGLGTMRFGLRAKSVEKVEDVKAGLISSRRIIFTPTTDLKDELADTAVQITCYDRNARILRTRRTVATPRTGTALAAAQRVATPTVATLAVTPAATAAKISTRISVLNFRDYDEERDY